MMASMLGLTAARAIVKRWRSAPSIAINCRRRVTSAARSCCCALMSGQIKRARSCRRANTLANSASMRASIRSVLAEPPMDLAKSRACRGLTTRPTVPRPEECRPALLRSRPWPPSPPAPPANPATPQSAPSDLPYRCRGGQRQLRTDCCDVDVAFRHRYQSTPMVQTWSSIFLANARLPLWQRL